MKNVEIKNKKQKTAKSEDGGTVPTCVCPCIGFSELPNLYPFLGNTMYVTSSLVFKNSGSLSSKLDIYIKDTRITLLLSLFLI